MSDELHCSFCSRSEHRVQKLVAGPGVYICDRCVAIAARIMADADSRGSKAPLWQRLVSRLRALFGVLRLGEA